MQEFVPLRQDRSFWEVISTQFLGAFNENLGTESARILKTLLGGQRGINSAGCFALAIIDTFPATLARTTVSAEPILQFTARKIFVGPLIATTAARVLAVRPVETSFQFWGFGSALLIGGFIGGWIAFPLQVFIQVHPLVEFKGRVLSVMNLMTWIGILMPSLYYFAALTVTGFQLDPSWILLSIGFIVLAAGVASRLATKEHLADERLGAQHV